MPEGLDTHLDAWSVVPRLAAPDISLTAFTRLTRDRKRPAATVHGNTKGSWDQRPRKAPLLKARFPMREMEIALIVFPPSSTQHHDGLVLQAAM